MILLSGHSLTAARKIMTEDMSLTLNERESSATFTPTEMTGINVGAWMQDDRNPGAGIVWRVTAIQETYLTQTPRITLEHAINTLRDRIIFGKITAADITGRTDATTCTAREAVQYILNKQSDWILGSFDYDSVSNPYKFDGDTLFDALETVSNSLSGSWWSYDFSSYPFKLNITEKSESVGTVLRAGRNVTAITKTIDTSGMYTRFYPIGKDDLHVSGDYVSKNENLYGVIAKVEVDPGLESVSELTAWANERLDKHAQPRVTINVSGLELADATGETLDALRLGTKCRIPLQEYGTTILETITELQYQEKTHKPKFVQVTLANTQRDITRIVADIIRSGGAGGRGAARQQKEDHAWFEDTNEHVAMVAEGIVGVDASGNPNWTRLSEIIVSGNGIDMRVTAAEGTLVTHSSQIHQDETQISTLVTKTGISSLGQNETLYSQITQTANAISAEVTRATGAENALSGSITVNSNKIALVVSESSGSYVVNASSIVLGINNQDETSQSYVDISADKINLTGYVTASELAATNGYIDNLINGRSVMNSIQATNAYLGTSGGGNVSIYGQTVRIYTVKDTNGTNRYVYGYA